jgi:hypothetical protein
MWVVSMATVAFNHRADFLFFEKGIDIAKDGVEVEAARRINIDNTVICKHWLALRLDLARCVIQPTREFDLPIVGLSTKTILICNNAAERDFGVWDGCRIVDPSPRRFICGRLVDVIMPALLTNSTSITRTFCSK